MSSVFTRIIDGELPAHFVWEDDKAVAFLSIEPLRPGHTLVVPRREVDHWIDLAPDEWAHLSGVARHLGEALDAAYGAAKVGMMLAGLDVPHVHIHLVPIDGVHDLDFANADRHADPDELASHAARIRAAISGLSASPTGE